MIKHTKTTKATTTTTTAAAANSEKKKKKVENVSFLKYMYAHYYHVLCHFRNIDNSGLHVLVMKYLILIFKFTLCFQSFLELLSLINFSNNFNNFIILLNLLKSN